MIFSSMKLKASRKIDLFIIQLVAKTIHISIYLISSDAWMKMFRFENGSAVQKYSSNYANEFWLFPIDGVHRKYVMKFEFRSSLYIFSSAKKKLNKNNDQIWWKKTREIPRQNIANAFYFGLISKIFWNCVYMPMHGNATIPLQIQRMNVSWQFRASLVVPAFIHAQHIHAHNCVYLTLVTNQTQFLVCFESCNQKLFKFTSNSTKKQRK